MLHSRLVHHESVKVDVKEDLACYRASRGQLDLVEVPPLAYLMVDGHGDPNTDPLFATSIESLYPVAYALKFASKDDLGRDYVVPPLEGLWWAEDMDVFTTARDKAQWSWTLMIMTPDWIEHAMFEAAVERVVAKRRPQRLADVRLETLTEGQSVQTLHVGSFEDETETLRQLHEEFIPAHGLRPAGRHHEIYLSDFRRVAPERQRTILRQPVVQ